MPNIDDYEYFECINKKVRNLINVFYNGDELSKFEKEVEKSYLILKNETSIKCINNDIKYGSNNKDICIITNSELNKLSGIKNFRVNDSKYHEFKGLKFNNIFPEYAFNTLHYIRLKNLEYNYILKYPRNVLKRSYLKYYYSKLKLSKEYSDKLISLGNINRTIYSSKYITSQINAYINSFEFINEFNFNLNFKLSFKLLLIVSWIIIQRLDNIALSSNKDISLASECLSNNIFNEIYYCCKDTVLIFDNLKEKGKKVTDLNFLINKIYNQLTFMLNILPSIINKKLNSNTDNVDNKDKIINSIVYLGLPVLINEILELNKSSEIVLFSEIIENIDDLELIDSIDFNNSKSECNETKDKIDKYLNIINSLYTKYDIFQITEFFISNYKNINNKNYFQIENAEIEIDLEKMNMTNIYNAYLLQLKDLCKYLNKRSDSYISFKAFCDNLLQFYSIEKIDIDNELAKSKYYNHILYNDSKINIIKYSEIVENTLNCKNCYNETNKKINWKIRAYLYYRKNFYIPNTVKEEEKLYKEEQEKKNNLGKEKQVKIIKNKNKLGLNSLVLINKNR